MVINRRRLPAAGGTGDASPPAGATDV